MKKLSGVLFICFIVLFNLSCKKTKEKVDEATEFDIHYSTNLSVPSNTLPVNTEVNFNTPDVPTQSTSKFLEYKTTQQLVDDIRFTKFRISETSGANLDFLKSLSIYVKASGMSEQLVATKNPIATGQTSIDLDLQDVNIKNYIFQQNIQFRVTVAIDASTLNGQTLKLDETVHVKATILD
ncbi:MAG: hypothetical protein K0S12_1393 [Bacteroidetes bacterium]|nr:hypothetical protein [Bacteroidota bacterium]